MAKNPGTPIGAGPNPEMNSEDGHINPSAPSAGTEGWGMTSDEQRALGPNDPQHTRNGQMKGNPGDHMTAASQRASDSATTNKRPADNEKESDSPHRTSEDGGSDER